MNKAPVIRFFYQNFLKKIFFRIDPEVVHDHMVRAGIFLGSHAFTRAITRWFFDYQNDALKQQILGITFANPVGLSAGFDKNAELTDILPCVGFGFVEVGSVTGEPCAGNPKPRLWRLPQSKGLVVYYGLKNDGCVAIANRLRNKKFAFPVGVSIAKTNCERTAETQAGITDYTAAYMALKDIGDYITVNISCPNAFGGQPFTDTERLEKLLASLDAHPSSKPIFIKLSPDLSDAELDDIIRVSENHHVDGFICTNLVKKRENIALTDTTLPETGGVSGRAISVQSDRCIATVYKKTGGKKIIIGVGGIFSAEDAYAKIRLGASLLQLITGMIFEGPQLIGEINRGLVRLLKRDGFSHISEAVGVDNK